MKKIPREWVERAARVYKSNAEASKALGIAMGSFSRLCRKYGIETPTLANEEPAGRPDLGGSHRAVPLPRLPA